MTYILALDQGTTSSRALLFDREGMVKACGQKEFKQYYPKPGLVEHDPQEIWSSQAAAMGEAMAHAGIEFKQIAAIGITNQRETTIIWERSSGKPISNAIVWQDRRTADYCGELKEKGYEDLVTKKTGLLLDPYFSGTKVRWLLHNIPGAMEKAKRGELAFGTVDSWLIWKLTRGQKHVTDVTNASRTLLYNIHTHEWDQELLDIFEIPKSLLPEVHSCSEELGKTASFISHTEIPICGIAGDQQAALIGQGCLQKGMAKTTYGTGCFLLMNTGSVAVTSHHRLLTTIAYQIGQEVTYALEGSVFMGGAVVQWLRDSLGLIKTAEEIEKLAISVPNSNGVYFIPAFTGLGAPYWNPYTRGTLFGLTRGTTAAHLARAALEGICFQVMDVLKAMENDAGLKIPELRVDGGAVKDDLLMQIQADFLQIPVLRPKQSELTALGAAYLAGHAIDFWQDGCDITSYWQLDRTFNATQPADKIEKAYAKWHQAIHLMQQWQEK